MTKRKINKQQRRNIEKNKSDPFSFTHSPPLNGRVISHRGKLIEIETPEGATFFCQYRQNLGAIVTGDEVLWVPQENSEYGLIGQTKPRQNVLLRPNKLSPNHKTMAANIDQLIIMIAVNPAPIEHYIDRYLVAAKHMGVPPIIVLNKVDLLKNLTDTTQFDQIQTLYNQLGYTVITLSAIANQNMDVLKKQLSHQTSIIIGQSGVGKSETLNTLFGHHKTTTGIISEQNNRGKHTTTSARLFHLDEHTHLIDSPGIREFGIWHLSELDIFAGFCEFNALDKNCKFRNCTHLDNAKGCVVVEAMQAGKISPQRFINYHRLIQEIRKNSK